ncbi:TadE/TadG family type IV pilus assembly protein [Bdellovibrio sp. HCB337]|uniref:TadE/TadG family type IV pilus assembly protein n=1 Tax=Bdellovibrio sp. HCB337 TaxID=3394358 RepID=UPI0039A65222
MVNQLFTRIRNRRGQVAIFIALIFQVLFLFFAMIINVGLLVHHKINLQNSVDLAAYYGAMKQAESMNAIGHINYQIRQSWKLLAWRYRQIGTAGDFGIHPYNKLEKKIGRDEEGYPQSLTGTQKDYYEAPAFCVAYSPFVPMPSSTESLCKLQSNMTTIGLPSAPGVIAGFLSINTAIQQATNRAIDESVSRCKYAGQFNYMILAQFKAAYNIDQGQRKQLINMLSRGLSAKEDDFRDISGDWASDGIRKTLENNLTEANRNSLGQDGLKILNGLGTSECNAVGRAAMQPAKWLAEIKIQPAFIYMDFYCDRSRATPQAKELTEQLPNNHDQLEAELRHLSQFGGPLPEPYTSSLGVEKNPWCMAYVGVSAETKPHVPFAPLGGVKLKARAFAKPFGGKIGPWYYAQWARGGKESNGGKRTDPLAPWREGDKNNTAGYKDTTRIANFSRYVGDKAGMKSRTVQGQYGRAIHNISPIWSRKSVSEIDGEIGRVRSEDEPNFFHWSHLGFDFNVEKSGDILAWNTAKNSYPKMRDLEISAILPDQFDLTYYSIEPDFYHNYYLKIKNEYTKKVPGFTHVVRPDLGARLGDKTYEEFSIKDQYKVWDRLKTNDFQADDPKVDFDTKLMYIAKKVSQVLTSWVGKDLSDYSLDTEKFGKCLVPDDNRPAAAKLDPPTSGDCLNGGRTGYSVKMVSGDYLRAQDLELGGESAGSGALLNPPDEDF